MRKQKTMKSKWRSGGGSLPDDIVKKILTKLPVKSLLRFKCVSKNWYSLITADSHFITTHFQCQSNSSQLSLLLAKKNSLFTSKILLLRDEPKILNFDTSYIKKNIIIDDMTVCSNGLVSLLIKLSKNSSRIILWNPATRQFRNLPEPSVDGLLAFDKISLSSGFDIRDKDYKLLRMALIMKSEKAIVHVFSLKSNSWREIRPWPRRLKFRLPSCRVELNGVLYWLGYENQDVMSFDLNDEEFQEMYTPSTDRSKTEVVEIVKWKGKTLAVVILSYYTDEFEFWSMQENDISFGSKPRWTKHWTVSTPFVGTFVYTWRWLGVWKDRFLVVRVVGRGSEYEETLMSYNLPRGKKKVVIQKRDHMCSNWSVNQINKAFEYVESLVSVYTQR